MPDALGRRVAQLALVAQIAFVLSWLIAVHIRGSWHRSDKARLAERLVSNSSTV